MPNQSLQQTLDPVATSAAAKPAPASIAAESRRYAAPDTTALAFASEVLLRVQPHVYNASNLQ